MRAVTDVIDFVGFPYKSRLYFLAQITTGGRKEQVPVRRDASLPEKIRTLICGLREGDLAILKEPGEIDLVGHRVVCGGLEFAQAAVVTPEVEAAIDRLGELAPFHNPVNLVGIRACRTILGDNTSQYAVCVPPASSAAGLFVSNAHRLIIPNFLNKVRKGNIK